MRREVPLILTFAFGTFIVLSNFVVWSRWKEAAESVNNWALIVIAFTYVLGVGNLLRVHGGNIVRTRPGWVYSATTVAGLVVMLLFGMCLWLLPQAEGGTDIRFSVTRSVEKDQAVRVMAPPGSGDLFDLRSEAALVKDDNGDGRAGEGDEIECRIRYAYSGADTLPSAVFAILYDADALVPLGFTGEAIPLVPRAPRSAGEGKAAAGVSLGLTAIPGGLSWEAGPIRPGAFGTARAGMGQSSVFNWFYEAVYVPMQSTMYALLAFFISSAAFRAFRVRSSHAVLLGATAVLVILGSVPLGEAVWSRFPDLVGWVMNDLQTAGKRAILIGAALGAIATGMKMIVGTEKSYLSAE